MERVVYRDPNASQKQAHRRQTWQMSIMLSMALLIAGIHVGIAHAATQAPALTIGISSNYRYASMYSNMSSDLQKITSAGIRNIREDITWADVQPTATTWNWVRYDLLFATAADRHARIMPILGYGVRWATGEADDHVVPRTPAARRSFAAYASAVAARYGPQGKFWEANPRLTRYPITSVEVWNEPWYPGPTNPADYIALVKETSAAVRRIKPSIKILANADPRIRPLKSRLNGLWMTAVLDVDMRIGEHVDGWTIHPYVRYGNLRSTAQADDSLFQVSKLRSALASRRLAATVWVTEIGFVDQPSTANESNNAMTSAANYAAFVRGASGMSGHNPVVAVYGFTAARETAHSHLPSAWDFGYNMFTESGSPKAALTALAQSSTRR